MPFNAITESQTCPVCPAWAAEITVILRKKERKWEKAEGEREMSKHLIYGHFERCWWIDSVSIFLCPKQIRTCSVHTFISAWVGCFCLRSLSLSLSSSAVLTQMRLFLFQFPFNICLPAREYFCFIWIHMWMFVCVRSIFVYLFFIHVQIEEHTLR